jgi:hypothetical protein
MAGGDEVVLAESTGLQFKMVSKGVVKRERLTRAEIKAAKAPP